MKRILLPTDFSKNAYNAIRYALRLYQDQPCAFYLLNTYTPATYIEGATLTSGYTALQLEQMAATNSKMGLDKTEDRIRKEFHNPKHVIKKISSFNMLVSEINSVVTSLGMDLIVMGTKGATGAKEVFIGTQTMYTIKKVKCPVIAVPENFEYTDPKELLFVTDFKCNPDNRFLHDLKDIADDHNARVNFLNVHYHEDLSEEQELTKDYMDRYFGTTSHVFHTFQDVDIEEAIDTFQKEHRINLLSMIHNKHSFFENLLFKPVINQIAFHTSVPFLVIPSEQRINS